MYVNVVKIMDMSESKQNALKKILNSAVIHIVAKMK